MEGFVIMLRIELDRCILKYKKKVKKLNNLFDIENDSYRRTFLEGQIVILNNIIKDLENILENELV